MIYDPVTKILTILSREPRHAKLGAVLPGFSDHRMTVQDLLAKMFVADDPHNVAPLYLFAAYSYSYVDYVFGNYSFKLINTNWGANSEAIYVSAIRV